MDTTKLFEAALGVIPPWRVAGLEFKAGAKAGGGPQTLAVSQTTFLPRSADRPGLAVR